ncbi:MAG: gyrase, subunit, partial [Verrucomicrobiaceae bacterium]|nr:gyrase, subunit [Verrucomicrobiaceae bacterium]
VVAAMAVHDNDELMLITSKGQNVRIRVGGDKGIRETGRNAQGVKLMDLKKDETIQDVATVIAEPDEEIEAGEETVADGSVEAAVEAGENTAEATDEDTAAE